MSFASDGKEDKEKDYLIIYIMDKDLYLSLKETSPRSEKRAELLKTREYRLTFKRFYDGEAYTVKNFFENYKMVIKDYEGNDKTVYGFIVNDETYLSYKDVAFPRTLWRREIKNVDGEETITYTPLDEKIYQGDLAILFSAFKRIYKDAIVAFDLVYMAIAKHNESKFVSESFVYPTECFQRFKGEYTTSNFYLFNLKLGGTSEQDLNDIVTDICKDFDDSRH